MKLLLVIIASISQNLNRNDFFLALVVFLFVFSKILCCLSVSKTRVLRRGFKNTHKLCNPKSDPNGNFILAEFDSHTKIVTFFQWVLKNGLWYNIRMAKKCKDKYGTIFWFSCPLKTRKPKDNDWIKIVQYVQI